MVIPASLSRVLQLYAARPERQGFFLFMTSPAAMQLFTYARVWMNAPRAPLPPSPPHRLPVPAKHLRVMGPFALRNSARVRRRKKIFSASILCAKISRSERALLHFLARSRRSNVDSISSTLLLSKTNCNSIKYFQGARFKVPSDKTGNFLPLFQFFF